MVNEKLKVFLLVIIYVFMFEMVLIFFNNTGAFIYEGF